MLDKSGNINAFTILAEIKRYKRLFVGIFLFFVASSAIIAFVTTPRYQATTKLIPVIQSGDKSSNSSLSAVSSLFGGKMGNGGISAWNEALLFVETVEFSKIFISEQNLMQTLMDEHDYDVLWVELDAEGRDILLKTIAGTWLSKNISVEYDELTQLITLSISSVESDRTIAWTNAFVLKINEVMRQKLVRDTEGKVEFLRERVLEERNSEIRQSLVQSLTVNIERLALIDNRKESVFRTLDPPQLGVLKSPILTLNIAIGLFLGLFFGFLGVIVGSAYERYKDNDS